MYGFAQVRRHPTDFTQINATNGKHINEVDNSRFQHLTEVVESLEKRNIRISSFEDIDSLSPNLVGSQ